MDLKKKKYKPETEFEKNEFADLIDALSKIEEVKVSEEFDNNFLSGLDTIKVPRTFKQKLFYSFRTIKENHPIKLYTITATAAIILLIFVVLPFKESKMPEKVFTNIDSTKSFIDQNSLNREYDENNNITTAENKTAVKDSLNKSVYLKSLINDLDNRYGLSISTKEKSTELINKIIEGNLFQKSIENRENLKRSDTLKLLFKIITEKK